MLARAQDTLMAEELAAVRGELARVDAKCATLIGLAGAALAFLVTQIAGPAPLAVRVLLGGAAVVLAVAAVVLLAVIRPRLGTVGFCRYAAMTSDEIRRMFTAGEASSTHERRFRAESLLTYSRITRRKYGRLRVAVDLLGAGVVLLGAGVVAGAIT